jgi:hypothetical protein
MDYICTIGNLETQKKIVAKKKQQPSLSNFGPRNEEKDPGMAPKAVTAMPINETSER